MLGWLVLPLRMSEEEFGGREREGYKGYITISCQIDRGFLQDCHVCRGVGRCRAVIGKLAAGWKMTKEAASWRLTEMAAFQADCGRLRVPGGPCVHQSRREVARGPLATGRPQSAIVASIIW